MAEPFALAVHRQVVANGGTKFDVANDAQQQRCIENFSRLIDQGFVTPYVLQTPESPVSTLVLYKHAYGANGYAGRVEDIVTQEGLEKSGLGKVALRCAMRVASSLGATAMTLECESTKPYGVPVYQAVGFDLTELQPARFTHDPLQKLNAEMIASPDLLHEAVLVVTHLETVQEMPLDVSALGQIGAGLPLSCRLEIKKDGRVLASADKEDRFSIIRASTFDFSKPAAAGQNESPIGSQMDNFVCALDPSAEMLDCFRALAQLIAAPQARRTDKEHSPLPQSFMDVSVDIKNPQHQLIVQHYGLEVNSYATPGDLADSYAQIYWLSDAQRLATEAQKAGNIQFI